MHIISSNFSVAVYYIKKRTLVFLKQLNPCKSNQITDHETYNFSPLEPYIFFFRLAFFFTGVFKYSNFIRIREFRFRRMFSFLLCFPAVEQFFIIGTQLVDSDYSIIRFPDGYRFIDDVFFLTRIL